MAEPTLAQIFGTNASQTPTQLIVSKNDLAAEAGLNPVENNTAESLWLALFLLAAKYLTQANADANLEQQLVIAESPSQSIVQRNNESYRQVNYTLETYTPDINFTLNVNSF